MLLLLSTALAGDLALYQSAQSLLRAHYLWEDRLLWGEMFEEAGQQLESRVEWLLVEPFPDHLSLRDGRGQWSTEIPLVNPEGFPMALSQLEDAVRGAGLPIDPALDLRVEILKGVLKPLDRHSAVLSGDNLERFDERLLGTLSGVGATIGPDQTGHLVIKALYPNGPAALGGLQIGDILLRIDGTSAVGMTSRDATQRIRGQPQTTVTLTVQRGLQVLDLNLQRVELTIPNVDTQVGPLDIGVVHIDHFSEQTTRYLQEGLHHLEEMEALNHGLIVDLRGNTGGSLMQSARAADMFLSEGMIVRTAGRAGATVPGLIQDIRAQPDLPGFQMPLVVLMDPATASGSEIMAGSLAQLGRGLLVGSTSFGKGTVQKTFAISKDIKLKLTIAEYILANDVHVADIGLAPDLALSAYHFSKEEIWYPEPERFAARFPANTPILPVVIGEHQPDAFIALAAQLVAATQGIQRSQLLQTLSAQLPTLKQAADTALVEAFKTVGIDWQAGTSGLADIEVLFEDAITFAAGKTAQLNITVHNRGAALHRAALRFHSVNPLFEDRVLPLGFLEAGLTQVYPLNLTVPPGPARRDDVDIILEVEGQPSHLLSHQILGVDAKPLPSFMVEAHFVPCPATCAEGQRPELQLLIKNTSKISVPDLVARLEFPEDPNIELLQEASTPTLLRGHRSVSVALGLRTGEEWSGTQLSLNLVLESKGLGRLLRLPLKVPVLGQEITVVPPTIVARAMPTTHKAGTLTLNLQATDDSRLDHLVVFAGTETTDRRHAQAQVEYKGNKLAWEPGTGHRMELSVQVPVALGTNRYTLIAEDDDGLRSSTVVYVLGLP